MATNTFELEFKRRIEGIKTRATAVGTSLTGLCQATGISRATPDRWAARPPKTIRLVDDLERALTEVEQRAARK